MTRRALVLTLAALLLAGTATVASAGGRYCGRGSQTSWSGTKTFYDGPSWTQPGLRRMGQRKLWSASLPTYYVCRPSS